MKYRISYFPEQAGKCNKFVVEEDDLPFMLFVSKIRGLQTGGGQGALPGIADVHLGPILVEQLGDTQVTSQCYLIATDSLGELTEAREIRDAIGCRGMAVPKALQFMANQCLLNQREIIDLRARCQAAELKLKEAGVPETIVSVVNALPKPLYKGQVR